MKTYPHILAAMALAAFCSYAAGRDVTQVGDTVQFTFTDITTRVSVNPPVRTVNGVIGPNLLCHQDIGYSGQGADKVPTSFAGDLKTALLFNVNGKSASDLIALLEKVNKASDRDAKVKELFGLPPDQMAQSVGGGIVGATFGVVFRDRQLLEMGQPATVLGAPGDDTPDLLKFISCYTTQQIDQAIVEGIRVVKAIIRALPAPNSTPQPK